MRIAGLPLVPAVAIREEVEAGLLASVEVHDFHTRPSYTPGLVYKKGRYLSRAAQSLLEALRVYFESILPLGQRGTTHAPRFAAQQSAAVERWTRCAGEAGVR